MSADERVHEVAAVLADAMADAGLAPADARAIVLGAVTRYARGGRPIRVNVDGDGTQPDCLRVVVESPTGVVYHQQCAGLCCWEREVEGFVVPVGGDTYHLEPPGRVDPALLRGVSRRGVVRVARSAAARRARRAAAAAGVGDCVLEHAGR